MASGATRPVKTPKKKKRKVEARQTAAMPVIYQKGRIRVLMVTSRDTGRWIMPKGWLMNGKKPWRAAEIEALEEAGAVGQIGDTSLGVYHYKKVLDDGSKLYCAVDVYPMVVDKLKRRWKERSERKRRWFSPAKAAKLVREKELADLLKQLAKMPDKRKTLKKLIDS